ncbi:hypothetical protein CDD82_6087 [Ophiocordyceps australis]|uniref:Uncharacterized protein n=1 Tax=Ophiocordyceps australis TaxID=1399860 RepID=A0A2C5ZW82_9HYPO|nr:hypothetical protein CDD82_6087 [Ophiocordyceps australis]
MAHSESLELPSHAALVEPGAHQLSESSDEEDQFTDARSGPASPRGNPQGTKAQISQINDESYSSQPPSPVPNTLAQVPREQDALPDQASLVAQDSSREPRSSLSVPIASIEKCDSEPLCGQVPATAAYNMDRRDAQPELASAVADESNQTTPFTTINNEIPATLLQEIPASEARDCLVVATVMDTESNAVLDETGEAPNNHEDFGDDFDDFEEGGQDNDFDDFDDGFQQPLHQETSTRIEQPSLLPFPIVDLDGLVSDDIMTSTAPILDILFPPESLSLSSPPSLPKESSIFITPRSAPLWSQLVAPPPLAPPDWIRSRTRRLFLVSLGVPVDLDEILPASKQKKLILPSLNATTASPRTSSDSRSASQLRQGDVNASSTSLDSQGQSVSCGADSRRRKGPPPQPELDLVAARYLCTTTDEALNGMTDEELKNHIAKLKSMQGAANDVLEYWKKRADEKIGDREAFEGVIENLVKHARKVRK